MPQPIIAAQYVFVMVVRWCQSGDAAMDDESFRLWAEIDEAGTPGNPWGLLAYEYHHGTGSPISDCVDRLVVHYLRSGIVHPLTALLELGLAPSPKVLKFLAQMLEPSTGTEEQVPYQLDVKRRSGHAGDISDPSTAVRDSLIYHHAVRLGATRRGYRDRAVDEARNLIDPDHRPSFDTALKAYKKHRKRSLGK